MSPGGSESAEGVALSKAEESLAVAEVAFAAGHFNSCASRSYYACFQAATAALIHEGIWPRGEWSHTFVHSQFVGLLINRRHLFDPRLRLALEESDRIRRIADYSLVRDATEREAWKALQFAQAIVGALRGRRG